MPGIPITVGKNTDRHNLSSLTPRLFNSSARGFTLIELLVSVAIIAILSAVSLAALRGFGERQKVQNASGQTVTNLRKLSIDAFSGVKDSDCDDDGPDNDLATSSDNDTLIGYFLYVQTSSSTGYAVGGICSDMQVAPGPGPRVMNLETKFLPSSVRIEAFSPFSPPITIVFKSANQGVEFYKGLPISVLAIPPESVDSVSFVVTDGTVTYQVTIDSSGRIGQEKL